MADISSFREKLGFLVSKFDKDKNHYLSKGYPEAQVRVDFINPLFKALGWDIENKAQKPPHERDVIVELSPETTGRPDYNFRINGATKFFVEVKAPSVALDDVKHILQAKTYAWSTKEVYFVVLTDFEEFRLYDASLRPDPKFPDEGLIFKLKHTEYIENIGRLWELSKERVEQGSLEALLPKDTKSKRLRVPPDKSFLEDLTGWRTELAKDIHKRNPSFNVKLLNDAVQRLLDRIVFIRIAEDRRIRPERGLWEVAELWKAEGRRKQIMTHLRDIFHEVNDDLNGDIFKPHACESTDVDSSLLAEIIESLYFPKSRYRFDAIGVELLGSIYERYLGSTIRVTPQRVKVEEKPEVRKAGGVYYTPKYIVDYIVKNTVGKLIEGKTPKQIEKIKILDPACGSGSFLLGAYQCLIDYHIDYYRRHPKDRQTLDMLHFRRYAVEEALTIHEKARILRNNIFGVDIDPQAVEITMMSLYLKALEGERGLLPRKQHLLPPLSNNIKCGNSLIGYDILDNAPQPPLNLRGGEGGVMSWGDKGRMKEGLLSDEEKSRINPFDWNSKTAGFGEIMEAGGFDCVIGNPPYVRIQAMKEWAPVEVEFYKQHYKSASKGNYDIYVVFVEKGLSILSPKGRLGFILPHKFFQSQYGESLRDIISKGKNLSEVVHFGDQQVFEGASTYTCLMFLDKGGSKHCNFIKADDLDAWVKGNGKEQGKIPVKTITKAEWNFVIGEKAKIFDRLRKMPVKLGDVADIFQGLVTGADKAFILASADKIEKDVLRPYLKSALIQAYDYPNTYLWMLFPYYLNNGRTTLISKHDFQNKYPNAWRHLKSYEKLLRGRERGKWNNDKWYAFGRSQNLAMMDKPKLIIQVLSLGPRLIYDDRRLYMTGGGGGPFYGVRPKNNGSAIFFLLGILNSKLFGHIIANQSTQMRGGYIRFSKQYINNFPIRTIDFTNKDEKSLHDRLVSLVERMLDLHKKKSTLPPSAEREKIEREIAVTDERIDEIVYGLYGITDEERRIIEG